jgi:hypothetical protein
MKLERKIRGALAATALVSGSLVGGVAAAGPASAATGCASDYSLSWSFPYYDGSGHLAAIGYLYQYSQGACAELVSQGSYSGEGKYMEVQIKSPAPYLVPLITDQGTYAYYAGPITATPGYGSCLVAAFKMNNSSGGTVVNDTETTNCD